MTCSLRQQVRRLFSFVFFFFLIATPTALLAQSGQWIWVGGSDQGDNPTYGTQGTFSASNLPGGRGNSSYWQDAQGRLWLFGGAGIIAPSLYGAMDDLWIFDPAQGAHGEWTWQAGPQNPGDYGVFPPQGQFSDENVPSARLGAMNWLDKQGRLWIFGGWLYGGPDYYADLWVFDPSKGQFGQWAWMGGLEPPNSPGVYGKLGVPAAANSPGSRGWGITWTDAQGNLWLFGGGGEDGSGNGGELNDVWVFNPSLGQFGEWTWVGGSATANPTGIYSAQGNFSAANMPGGRNGSAFWTDSQGNLWVFGGVGIDAVGSGGDLADMWEFNASLGKYGEWAFMGGTEQVIDNGTGVSGTLGVPAPGNVPEARNWAQFWEDSYGNLWICGGDDDRNKGGPTTLNDLWVYSPTVQEWAEIDAGTRVANYGTEYVAAASNFPGERDGGAVLTQSANNVLIFGGASLINLGLNDLWLYTPTPTAAEPVYSVPGGSYATAQNVAITTATAGATIYYTTDGSVPSASSHVYSTPITIAPVKDTPVVVLNAIAVANGYLYSPMQSAAYAINATATPTFSPAAGTYTAVQTVTISDATSGSTIYYTTDGSTPTTGSTKYGTPITVSATETVQAVASSSGHALSSVGSATYTINYPAATPTFSPAAGTYTSVQMVTISDATSGATIYYTTDRSTPTTNSAQYTGAITVNASETIKAVAIANGYSVSNVASAAYTINLPPAATPSFSPVGGTYTAVQMVTISDATPGATIYYTTDGSAPTTSSTAYATPITVGTTETIQAVASSSATSLSSVGSATYTINLPIAATPTFSPAAGTYTSAQSVTISDTTAGVTIYYTTDGSPPTSGSSAYSGAISVSATETLNAIAMETGYVNSSVASAAYSIQPPPDFSLAASPQSLNLSNAQNGTITVSVTPVNNFVSSVSFACSGLPGGASCSFAPATVTPSGAAATTTLTVSVSSASMAAAGGAIPPIQLLAWTTLVLALCGAGWRKRVAWPALAAGLVAAALLLGCGAASGGDQTQPITSTVTVTATSGSLQHTTTFLLTTQ